MAVVEVRMVRKLGVEVWVGAVRLAAGGPIVAWTTMMSEQYATRWAGRESARLANSQQK